MRNFRIEPDGTIFHRQPRQGRKLSKPAGSLHRSTGYLRVSLNDQEYLAHRVAWVLYTGDWPTETIDHIDGDKTNNRYSNLRDVTLAENLRNVRKANNGSGIVGVSWDKRYNTWAASICRYGIRKYLGSYASLSAAIAARKRAESMLNTLPNSEDYK